MPGTIKKVSCVVVLLSILAGCSSVTTIKQAEAIPFNNCRVMVFDSLRSAQEQGQIDPLCKLSVSSAGSFTHTPESAIESNKSKACDCGANAIYVADSSPAELSVATAELVAFRFVGNSVNGLQTPESKMKESLSAQEREVIGNYSYYAKKMAWKRGCSIYSLSSAEIGSEVYRANCESGSELKIRCDDSGCIGE